MKEICTICTHRSDYDIRDAASGSITVGQLIDHLRGFDEDTKIVFMNDGGYTYGYIDLDEIEVADYKTKEEEEREEMLEEMESELEYEKDDRDEQLADLESRYENNIPYEDGREMTQEAYEKEKADILADYEKNVAYIKEQYKQYTEA